MIRMGPWALLLVIIAACANNEETPPHEIDQTPPQVMAPQPSGILAAGTTSTTLSVTTNEAASCKWDLSPATDFASMANSFVAGVNGAEHQAAVSGLTDGQSYVYYVRCSDAAGNVNDQSMVISFNVASTSDKTPPMISDGQPEGTLPVGATTAIMSVKTDENATCKWDTDEAASYAGMINTFAATGGTAHSMPLSKLADGQSYTYAVRCQDSAGNANTESAVISFSVGSANDRTPPVITDLKPAGELPAGTTSATMSVKTNEVARCRWGSADAAYASLPNEFTNTGSLAHRTTLTGLTNGQSYQRYVRCQDVAGNANASSAVVSFSVSGGSSGDVLYAWDHESEQLGVISSDNSGEFWNNHAGGGHGAGSRQEILNHAPLGNGAGKYVRFTVQKNGATTYRAERRFLPNFKMQTVEANHETHYVKPEVLWYGWRFRVDAQDDSIDATVGQFHEFGEEVPYDKATSPLWGVHILSPTEVTFWNRAHRFDPEISDKMPKVNYKIGQTYKVIFQVRWDTRKGKNGGTGLMRIWFGDSATPVYEKVNVRTCYKDAILRCGSDNCTTPQVPFWKVGVYKASYKGSGTTGDKTSVSYDNFVIMGNDGSWSAVNKELDKKNFQ